MTKFVALYCRISQDKGGRIEGVRRQEKWGRAYAEKHWPGIPVRVFADNDMSAATGAAIRTGFEALREAIRLGEVAHLWVVEQSRLERSPEGFFRLGRELAAAGLTVFHTNREGIVLAKSLSAKIKALVNEEEVELATQRCRDTLKEKAERGEAPGSLPFGYVHGVNERGVKTYVVVEAAAEVIRECADRVLAGWSLSSIASDLRGRTCMVCPDSEPEHTMHGPHRQRVRNHECDMPRRKKCDCPYVTVDGRDVDDGGVPVTRRSTITGDSVRKWLSNPTVAGRRVHQKADLGPGTGNWPAILDEHTWEAVRTTLAAPRVVRRSDGGTYPIVATTARTTGRRYLLTSGIARCGVCTAPLIASMKQLKKGQSAPYYLCNPKTGGKGCIGIKAEPFEKHVVKLFLNKVDEPGFRAALNQDPHVTRRAEIEKEVARLETKLEAYRDQFDDDLIDRRELDRRTQNLKKRQQTLLAEKAALPPPPSGDQIQWETLRDDWVDLTLDERRHFLSRALRSIAVHRAVARGGGRPGFNAERVGEPEWVTDSAPEIQP